MSRDLTQAQFEAKCKALGFAKQGFLGYYKLARSSVCVSIANAGPRRRSQLAYLIEQDKKYEDIVALLMGRSTRNR